jgi:putative MATE family efflux protein
MKLALDMTKGKEWKLIILFAIPVLFSNLFQSLYNIIDSIIVGKYVSKEALAAVSSSGNLIFLFNSFFIGLSSGAGVVIARYFGKSDIENMRKSIHNSVLVGLVSSLFLTLVGVLISPFILKAMGTPLDVIGESTEYFRIYFFGVSGVIMYNSFAGILQARGDSTRPLIFLIISTIINILLDLLFIRVFNMGVAGAGLATIISQFVSAILAFITLLNKKQDYHLSLKELRFNRRIMHEILYNGIPSGIQNSVIGLANVVVQSNINSFGSDTMAGCGAYSKVESFAFLPITCFQIALATFVSQNLGAGEVERAKRGSRFAIITSAVMAFGIGVIAYFSAPYLLKLFVNSDLSKEVADKVVGIGVRTLHTTCFFYPLLAYAHCTAATLRGSGHAIIPMVVMLSVWCVFRVIYVTFMMNVVNHEIRLLYTAYPVTWGISCIIYFIYYHFTNWTVRKDYRH